MRRCVAVPMLLLVGACVFDPVSPSGGVPTLDDAGSDGFVWVTTGLDHTCGVVAGGDAYCWGSNEFGQLGVPDDGNTCRREDRNIPCQERPVAVAGGLAFVKLSAGDAHTCGLATDERIYCWGDNLRGQLGDPTVRQTAQPVAVATTSLFWDVAAGGSHSCGLRTDGAVLCWGANDFGQLGTGGVTSAGAPVNSAIGQARFVDIEAGTRRTCARQSDGGAYCWGATWSNSLGGTDLFRAQLAPALLDSAPAFASLAVGAETTCGVTADNLAYCWEANPMGGIGDGTAAGSRYPVRVSGSTRFVAVSSGSLHTCGVSESGLSFCWGGGQFGQLGVSPGLLSQRCGLERQPCATVPVRVTGWRAFAQVSAGRGNHSCGLTLGGNVYCWGAGSMGQRGDGTASFATWAPARTISPSGT